jgi:hypothetical protein
LTRPKPAFTVSENRDFWGVRPSFAAAGHRLALPEPMVPVEVSRFFIADAVVEGASPEIAADDDSAFTATRGAVGVAEPVIRSL